MTRARLCRVLAVVAGVAALWAVVVLWTGGTVLRIGGIRLSSRSPRNPALLTFVCLAATWLLAPSGQRNRTLATECRRLLDIVASRLPALPATLRRADVLAAAAAVIVVIAGLTEGAFVVGGSDSYGYVSQAHLWTLGNLRQEPVLRRWLPPDIPFEVLAPLGYRVSPGGTTIAPIYSPGLPMVMAIFETLAGRRSVFWVVPMLGGLLVWATFLLGSRVHGPWVGAAAAVLVATSPPVLVQLTAAPMSDLPAAAWWALSLALIALDRRDAACAAGVAAGLAILTRPNLVPLTVIAGGLLIWRLIAARRSLGLVGQHAILFGLPAIAACVVIAALNRQLWGSVLTSGYGSLSTLAASGLANVWPGIAAYARAVAIQMPVVACLPLAALIRSTSGDDAGSLTSDRTMTTALWSFAVLVLVLYLTYPAFDSAWNLRFLLPAVAPVIVLASVAGLSLVRRFSERPLAASVVAMMIIGGYGVDYARNLSAFDTRPLRKFADIGDAITRDLPERAVLLSMLHSGSANYYSGRPTLRYDLLPPSRLDGLVEELTQRGYVPYLLVDADERADFQSRYRGHSRLAGLDWPPIVTLHPPDVQIYAIPARP